MHNVEMWGGGGGGLGGYGRVRTDIMALCIMSNCGEMGKGGGFWEGESN